MSHIVSIFIITTNFTPSIICNKLVDLDDYNLLYLVNLLCHCAYYVTKYFILY